MTVSSTSAPADSAASLAREPFINIDNMSFVSRDRYHFSSYILNFTLHCDYSLPDRDLWKDHPVWPALRSLTLLTAEAYSQHLHAWEKAKEHVSCLEELKNRANTRAERNGCPKPFEIESGESKTLERFDQLNTFNKRDWKTFVKERISDLDFDTGTVKTVTVPPDLLGSLVKLLRGSSRHGPQQGSRAELEGTSGLVSRFENSETQRLYLILTKVTRASQSPSHSYQFSAQVKAPITLGTVFSIKTKDGPVIDLLDRSNPQDEEA